MRDVMGTHTRRNTKAPAMKRKVIKPQQKGSLPVHLRNGGKRGEGAGTGWHTKAWGGALKFFFVNFLLLKTFPKKCVFSFMSG